MDPESLDVSDDDNDNDNDEIVIRICDQPFRTSRALLTKSSLFFKTVFEGLEEPNKEGEYVLSYPVDENDRECIVDSQYVHYIIEYINTGKCRLTRSQKDDLVFLRGLYRSCKYFGIDFIPDEIYFIDPHFRDVKKIYDMEPGISDKVYNINGENFSRGPIKDFSIFRASVIGVCSVGADIFVVYDEEDFVDLDSDDDYRRADFIKVVKFSTTKQRWYRKKHEQQISLPYGEIVAVGTNIYMMSSTRVLVYDTINDKTWEILEAPFVRQDPSPCFCVVGHDIFMFAGRSLGNPRMDSKIHDVGIWKFDTKERKWTKLDAKMPTPSQGHSACLWNDRVYIAGTGDTGERILCFNPIKGRFEQTDVPSKRGGRHSQIFVWDDCLYSGGMFYCAKSENWIYSKAGVLYDYHEVIIHNSSGRNSMEETPRDRGLVEVLLSVAEKKGTLNGMRSMSLK
jgi:hypothetical protein